MKEKYSPEDLIGKKINHLEIKEILGNRSHIGKPHFHVLVECDCGEQREARLDQLLSGKHRSCGCKKTTHGRYADPIYTIWQELRYRCSNPNKKHYSYYGGRGIKVCKDWDESFDAFLKDMGERPSPEHSIDRIDPDGDYCKENCRWATKSEQSRNTRKISSKKTTSKYKGVSFEKRRNHWVAQIYYEKGKRVYLGAFSTEEEAAIARDEAAKKYHKEFAYLNNVTPQHTSSEGEIC
jgi:hypothetical protein